ncbi:T9SS type A sorting domain-containing protein [Winogradskyella sp. A2]|uniref:T9SS type A sorting domain-containing protein n=1 Tax=Winogradskyella sp. A2 TaxID=3366944 RepID=UPI00398C2FFE
MKTNYLFLLLFLATLLNGNHLIAQSTEDFESETTGATTFTDNGQNFTIANGAGETTYDIEFFTSGGWNGTGADSQFIDNSSGNPTTGDGSSFAITTTDGTDITVKSFYLFVSNRFLSGPGTPTTITIEGRKDGGSVFTINKSSGIVDGSTFTPNNGFTFIDLASEGGTDNSNENIDELIISSTNNADYLALDAFTWDAQVLSINDVEAQQIKAKIFPNPSSDFIEIYGLDQTHTFGLYDILGKEIKKGILSNNDIINIQNLTNGMYFLKLENGNTVKFIKE